MDSVLKELIEGYGRFRRKYHEDQFAEYRATAPSEQRPPVMMIACSDSRVNPAILTHARLGQLFVVNNVANLVPPYKEGHDTHHSTSAALEFAVCYLKVKHVIVMGHSKCGGIQALMSGTARVQDGAQSATGTAAESSRSAPRSERDTKGEQSEPFVKKPYYSFIEPWVQIAAPAKKRVLEQYPDVGPEEQAHCCEKEALMVSLENLDSFPFVTAAKAIGELRTHAWYYELATGCIEAYNRDTKLFELLPGS